VVQQAQQQQQQQPDPHAAAAVSGSASWQDSVPASTVALLAGLCQKHRTAVASILMATAPLSLPRERRLDLHYSNTIWFAARRCVALL
jgi:threonine synthase